jgi:hypothetical protein
MKLAILLLSKLPLPSKRHMHNWCIVAVVLAAALDAFFPGHDDAYETLIIGIVVVFFADILFRGK